MAQFRDEMSPKGNRLVHNGKPRNFVIFYTAREGSSAIVSQLSLHPDIAVPVFEELDRYWIRKHKPNLDVLHTMDTLYAKESFDLPIKRFGASVIPRQPRGDEAVCGFKWRFHGDLRATADLFRKHDVKVFFLYRRDFHELASSLYFSNHLKVVKQNPALRNPQFHFMEMTPQERTKFRDDFEAMQIDVEWPKMLGIMGKRVCWAWYHRYLAERLRWYGLNSHTIFYEDFVADSTAFFADLHRQIGVASFPYQSDAMPLRKLSQRSAVDRLGGADRLKGSFSTRIMKTAYAAATST